MQVLEEIFKSQDKYFQLNGHDIALLTMLIHKNVHFHRNVISVTKFPNDDEHKVVEKYLARQEELLGKFDGLFEEVLKYFYRFHPEARRHQKTEKNLISLLG